MSNPDHQQTKKSTPKSQTKQSKTNSTPTDEDTVEVPRSFMTMMQPLLEFHERTNGVSRDDVRIYWDIHVLRGENELFARSKGISTIPGMLSAKQKANAPAAMQQEVVDKIAQPLIAACMEEGELQNDEGMRRLANSGMTDTPPSPLVTHGGDRMAGLAAAAEAADDEDSDSEEDIDP